MKNLKELKDLIRDPVKNLKYIIEALNDTTLKDYLVDVIHGNDDISSEDLEVVLRAANIIYSNTGDNTGLSDSEYDALVSLYEDKTNKELPTGAPLSSNDKVAAKYLTLRGTLSKVYKLTDDDLLTNKSQKTIDDWITKIKNIYKDKTNKNLDVSKLTVQVVPKYDGVSVVCEFDRRGNLIRALTRGDTTNNESKDITHIIKYVMPTGPFNAAPSEYAVKCEAMVLNKDLDEVNTLMNKEYKNTRAVASAIINSKEVNEDLVKFLHLIQLRYSYFEYGTESNQYMSNDMYDNFLTTTFTKKALKDIREWALKHANVYPGYRCDGAVICIMDDDVREILGRTGDKQNYEVAYKFTSENTISTVTDVVFQVGNLGKITPVVVFNPVKLKGNDVKRATISYQDFLRYKLSKGDEIKVIYDIVPSIAMEDGLKRSGKKPIKAITKCPECGSTLLTSESGKKLYCDNPDCLCRKKGKILNFVTKSGIENISYEIISDLYDAGFLTTIDDLYTLENHAKKINELPGYGATLLGKIFKSIDTTRVMTPSKFLGSIGIEGISIKKFHDLLQSISYDELIEYGFNKEVYALSGLPGIKDKSSLKIITGLYNNQKLIEKLEKYITIIDEPSDEGSFVVTFTKVRDEILEEYIAKLGGRVDNSNVTKDTNLVIVPKLGVTSSKVEKANQYHIPVIEIDKAKAYIDYTYGRK